MNNERINMDKKEIIIVIELMVILVLIGIILSGLVRAKDKEEPVVKKDTIIIKANIGTKVYYEKDGRNIILYNIESLKYNDKDLKEYDNPFEIVDKYVNSIDNKISYENNEVIIYKGSDFNILMCNTESNNKDVYIGLTGMKYEKGFCQELDRTFTKTYEILKIYNYDEFNYITFKDIESNVIFTKEVDDSFNYLEENKTYKIEFKVNNSVVDTSNNLDIFDKCDILNISLIKSE